jgi:hypothetical protein
MNGSEKEDLVKIVMEVDDEVFGVGGESLWAKPLGNDLYEVRNTPWHTCSIGWGDVVRAVAKTEDKKPEVVDIVHLGGHRTLHIFFFDECAERERLQVLGRLREWKAYHENRDGRMYAIDVEPGGDFDALCRYLDILVEQEKLDYRTVVSSRAN